MDLPMPIAFLKAALFTLVGAAVFGSAPPAAAQDLFEPVIKVNDQVITRYEIEQRARMLTLFRAPGDPERIAREQLVEDRLKLGAAEATGLELDEGTMQTAMAEFAQRGDMSADEMIAALADAGVEESTFRAFVRVGATWRELVRARFAGQISVDESDMERAKLALGGTSGVRVLLSEIVLPLRPGQRDQVQQRARELAKIEGTGAFADAARRFSAAPSADRGGRMDWTPISELPAALRQVVLGLSPGEVSDPLTTEQAVVLLQMRDIAETATPEPDYAAIEYASYAIDGGRSDAARQRAAEIEARVETCDDLYGVAKGQEPDRLQRESKTPADIPQDIAAELERLDPGEVSTRLTRSDGRTLMFLMLCGRTPAVDGDGPTADELTSFIRNKRLESYAEGYLAQLRAEARIVEP
jgi:peptidyl-prolyl cis-trans isomerase SurA